MTRWSAITYREFWDVPHNFVFEDGGLTWYFECPFDSETEDFADYYLVYRMPSLNADDLNGSWANLFERAISEVGRISKLDVRFDPTKRQFVDASILEQIQAPVTTAG
jgi:hypothetical protein